MKLNYSNKAFNVTEPITVTAPCNLSRANLVNPSGYAVTINALVNIHGLKVNGVIMNSVEDKPAWLTLLGSHFYGTANAPKHRYGPAMTIRNKMQGRMGNDGIDLWHRIVNTILTIDPTKEAAIIAIGNYLDTKEILLAPAKVIDYVVSQTPGGVQTWAALKTWVQSKAEETWREEATEDAP